ncbi:hypothetical protein PRUPE_6G198200 [Prunus persica]|uniref:DUF674 domain-containing protein n=1 Tax=Prunus persica TaxID=3760 RepID=M5WCK2_PRUPE|nr:uncharacterized protein LOC18775406 [Prunus persica]ONI02431.1 hypothetical protein PRUPE_6G198200 [Prunus persica]
MAASNSGTVSLKLLIDTTRNKVLFAEAGKDFVDFLFTLLSLPAGTIIRLLSKDAMVGSLGKLYESVETLNDEYLQPNLNKDTLLKPKEPVAAGPNLLGLLTDVKSDAPKTIYRCSNGSCIYRISYVADDPKAICPGCKHSMTTAVTYVASPTSEVQATYSGAGKVGYVKGLVTYMIMDDLEVKPLSTISCITLLSRFSVKDVGVLEEKVVDLGMDEGVKLLKASLQTKSVLTQVFLR